VTGCLRTAKYNFICIEEDCGPQLGLNELVFLVRKKNSTRKKKPTMLLSFKMQKEKMLDRWEFLNCKSKIHIHTCAYIYVSVFQNFLIGIKKVSTRVPFDLRR